MPPPPGAPHPPPGPQRVGVGGGHHPPAPGHHLQQQHPHASLLGGLVGAPPPSPAVAAAAAQAAAAAAQSPAAAAGFAFHPSAFNSGLAAAIAAAEFQKQREAAAAAHVFAVAHANGIQQPFLAGFPGAGGAPTHQGFGGHHPGLARMMNPQQQQAGAPHPGQVQAFLAARGGAQQGTGVLSPPSQTPPAAASASASSSIVGPPSASPSFSSIANAATTSTNGSTNAAGPLQPRLPIFSNGRPELPPPRWYDASIQLGVIEDKYYLSELQCVLRSEFVEFFGTTQVRALVQIYYLFELLCLNATRLAFLELASRGYFTDIVQAVHGRNKPIALGQVGIRCQHCKDVSSAQTQITNNSARTTQNAVSYPSFISGIYNTVQQMYRLHFDQCPYIPDELKVRVGNLKDSHTSNRGGRKQYWMESAKRIGLVDTSFGIHYGRDPEEPLPPLGGLARRTSHSISGSIGGTEENTEYDEWGRQASLGSHDSLSHEGVGGGEAHMGGLIPIEEIEIYPLVLPEDKPLISDYLYLALEQMQPCNLMDADRVGCYKGRRTGFPGLACRHCIGQAGCGRYFPASEASLSQTTTSQTIVNHVRNCRRCPLEIREQLELMKRAKTCPEYKKSDKPKHGGRKVFFNRLWCRIQRIPLPKNEKASPPSPENPPSSPLTTKGKTTPSPSPERKKRKKSVDLSVKDNHKIARLSSKKYKDDDTSDLEGEGGGDVMETVEFDNVHHDAKEVVASAPAARAEPAVTATTLENSHIIYQGRTRLTRDDDLHWLSEADCYIRTELAEVFTAQEEDSELFGDPEVGQVGIRCFYCAENKAPEDRHRGHVYFPSSVGAIQQAVSDLQRRHLGMCSEIPEDIRESFRSMKGYGAKPKGDTAQYWMDAAKELGLHDSHEGQGISFFRNPLDRSPADEIDIDKNDDGPTGTVLVPPAYRHSCTDHMLMLLKQFEPCQFRISDRKSSRSRDRALGFPGLICIHCKQKRYFPITEKKLQDSLGLISTHINNCFHAPLEVKASLCYLHHRSLLQKQELAGQWKFTFFKGVWNRLHPHLGIDPPATTSADASTTKEAPVAPPEDKKEEAKALPEEDAPPVEDNGAMEEEENDSTDNAADNTTDDAEPNDLVHESTEEEEHQENAGDEVSEMKDLIKSAALWLSERDAEYEARARGGRVKGIKRR
ncbi:hypothetical protein ACHAXR_010607 [Thalassiosira sp. AJA248-18]